MKNDYDQFVELCLKTRLEKNYDKQSIRKHNRAIDRLFKLRDSMMGKDCSATMRALLDHEDERVRLCAANFCFDLGVDKERALTVLESLEQDSKDKYISFDAKVSRLIKTGQWPSSTNNPPNNL